jgi:NDP-sugar pyrophosphorylase family protein
LAAGKELAEVYGMQLYSLQILSSNMSNLKPTLVILAAGMASRYGSMKQVEGFGPQGETIMEYSIYDAIKAGFGKVVFIIREEFADMFKGMMEPKLHGKIETAYVYQSINDFLPNGFQVPADRVKPWGTAHAILCAAPEVSGSFVVINADDYYGEDGFVKAFEFCVSGCSDHQYGIIGYTLHKTLSEHGSVSRGVCQTNSEGNLVAINERLKIYRDASGQVVYEDSDRNVPLDEETPVSMNFWCFSPGVFDLVKGWFQTFISEEGNGLKTEFLLPTVAAMYITRGLGNIKVIGTDATWFGVTYKEDAPIVKAKVAELVAAGKYPPALWG